MMRSVVRPLSAIVDIPSGRFAFHPVKYVSIPTYTVKPANRIIRSNMVCSHCHAVEGSKSAKACLKRDCPLK